MRVVSCVGVALCSVPCIQWQPRCTAHPLSFFPLHCCTSVTAHLHLFVCFVRSCASHLWLCRVRACQVLSVRSVTLPAYLLAPLAASCVCACEQYVFLFTSFSRYHGTTALATTNTPISEPLFQLLTVRRLCVPTLPTLPSLRQFSVPTLQPLPTLRQAFHSNPQYLRA